MAFAPTTGAKCEAVEDSFKLTSLSPVGWVASRLFHAESFAYLLNSHMIIEALRTVYPFATRTG